MYLEGQSVCVTFQVREKRSNQIYHQRIFAARTKGWKNRETEETPPQKTITQVYHWEFSHRT